MGRTKRLRQRKHMKLKKNSDVIWLFNNLVNDGWRNSSKLVCQDYANTGRGVCSKISIFPGDPLIKIPLKVMITFVTLENDKDFRNDLLTCKIPSHSLSFQCLLAFYLLYRNHIDEYKSNLSVYINSIPKTFSTPYFCHSTELYYLPEDILQQTVEQNRRIRDSYNIFQTAFLGKTCCCCGQQFLPDIITLNEYKWAYFAVNSRSVFLRAGEIKHLIEYEPNLMSTLLSDEPCMALAPFLDMFNHSDSANTKTQICNESNDLSFHLITNDSHKPYNQIFISYGNLTNFKLFTEYGFSLKQNMHDYFEISLNDIEGFLKNEPKFRGIHIHSNKFKFIRDHNLNDQMFINSVDGLSHNLQVTLYLIFKEESYFSNVLNQTAFGTNVEFENSTRVEGNLLALYKIKEYEYFIDGLLKINNPSCSAQAAMEYLKNCVLYLKDYIGNFGIHNYNV